MYIYSWNKGSEGGKTLAETLSAKRIKHENSRFKGGPRKIVINWGSSQLPEEVLKCKVLNSPQSIAICSNKLEFFRAIGDRVPVPDWTENHNQAMEWVAEGHTVCARTVLQGHSAEGLVLMDRNNPDDFVTARLYTKYIPKTDEYRVHIVKDRVVDVQRKALRNGWAEQHGTVNWKVRNLANGFVYMRNGINPPQSVLDVSVRAVSTIGLDFGAVDVIFNEKRNQPYVLEINTAPGIEGTTVENYVEAFKGINL